MPRDRFDKMRSGALICKTTSKCKEKCKPPEIGVLVRPLLTQVTSKFSEKHFTAKNLLLLHHESIEEGILFVCIFLLKLQCAFFVQPICGNIRAVGDACFASNILSTQQTVNRNVSPCTQGAILFREN
jgi:hypothetical protein